MLKSIAEIAIEAGEIIKRGISADKHINYKGRIDMVTDFDVRVETFLKEKLAVLFPQHEMVGEESAKSIQKREGNAIYIDPIDGTTNFIHGFPFVSISIGVYSDGEGRYGVVYNPILNELFTASKGGGAFLNGNKIEVSKTPCLEQSLCATGFPYAKDNIPFLMKMLEKTLITTRGIRRAGSAALDLCYVAKGVFDLYYETTLKPWDISAGIIIVREAGGIVTNLDGSFQDLASDTIIASNGLVHDEFLKLIIE